MFKPLLALAAAVSVAAAPTVKLPNITILPHIGSATVPTRTKVLERGGNVLLAVATSFLVR